MVVDANAIIYPGAMAKVLVSRDYHSLESTLTDHALPHNDCTFCNACFSMASAPCKAHRSSGRRISTGSEAHLSSPSVESSHQALERSQVHRP